MERSARAGHAETVNRKTAAIGLTLIAAVALASSLLVGVSPVLAVAIPIALGYLVLLRHNPSWIVHGLIVVCFTTTPSSVPDGFGFAGYYVYFYEFFLIGSAVYAIASVRAAPSRMNVSASIGLRATWLFVAAVVMAGCIGVMNGHSIQDIHTDSRPIADMLIGIFVFTTIVAVGDGLRYVKTVTAVLVVSAVVMIGASVAGVPLSGREETAQLYTTSGSLVSGGSDALRYLTQTTPLALAALLFCVALVALRRARLSSVAPILIASLVVSFLGFSRNTLLALAGTMLFVLIASFVNGWFLSTVVRLVQTVAIGAVVLGLLVVLARSVGGGVWIDEQISGYTNRVFAGLDQSTAAVDTSTQDRLQEDRYILRAADGHEVFGNGAGTRYKPAMGPASEFAADKGELYAHNFYGWLYVKSGIVGVSAFVIMVAAGLLPSLRRRYRSRTLAAASGVLFGVAIALIVMPLPLDHVNSTLFAMILGVCFGLTVSVSARKSSVDDRTEIGHAVA